MAEKTVTKAMVQAYMDAYREDLSRQVRGVGPATERAINLHARIGELQHYVSMYGPNSIEVEVPDE